MLIESVELPNTPGMSLCGDGGLPGSKPYAASGNYINKMSDYCKGCGYDVKLRTGPKACPFNYLYWDFLMRNRQKLGRIQRLKQTHRAIRRNKLPGLDQVILCQPGSRLSRATFLLLQRRSQVQVVIHAQHEGVHGWRSLNSA